MRRRVKKRYLKLIFFILVIRVQKGFAIRCMRPGVYLFLRICIRNSTINHDVPVSILDVSSQRMHHER